MTPPRQSRLLGDVPYPLTNFEIQEYYQNEPRFNWVFSRDDLPNTIHSHGAYVINLDEYHDIGTQIRTGFPLANGSFPFSSMTKKNCKYCILF